VQFNDGTAVAFRIGIVRRVSNESTISIGNLRSLMGWVDGGIKITGHAIGARKDMVLLRISLP